MGKYDSMIAKELYDAKPSASQDIKISTNCLLTAYKKLKAKVLVEIYPQDILEKLLKIKSEQDANKKNLLLNNLITELKADTYSESELYTLLNTIISNVLTLSKMLCGIEAQEMLDKVWALYQEKNGFYGDIWYNRRETGLCLDMGRKIVRIEGLMSETLTSSDNETICDTLLDLINYCTLMKVYLQFIK